jgi:hypothetical protein
MWLCTDNKTGIIPEYNETNLMHYLSSVYSVTIPLHVSGLLVAHHQEVAMYTLLPPDDGQLSSPKHA